MEKLIVTAGEQGQRLDKFLNRYLKEAGKGFLYKMLRKKNITLNGKRAEGSELLACGDEISLFLSQETLQKFKGTPAPAQSAASGPVKLDILFEDRDLLIINKPAGMLSQKAKPEDVSLCEHVTAYLAERDGTSVGLHGFQAGVVNRLDRNTSGLILASASLTGARELSELIRSRKLEKTYLAVVKGEFSGDGIYTSYLKKDTETNTVTISSIRSEDAEEVKTGIRLIDCQNGYSLLKIRLITGKPHQIRAVLSRLGYPILGDSKYGDETVNRSLHVKRQMLHSRQLTFPADCGSLQSVAGKSFLADLPADFRKLMDITGVTL